MVPPLVGVAVNVTFVPGQMVVELAAMLTLAGKFGFTVMVTVLEVAGLPVAQVTLDVNVQVIVFPFVNVADVNVGELVPAFTPFTFH